MVTHQTSVKSRTLQTTVDHCRSYQFDHFRVAFANRDSYPGMEIETLNQELNSDEFAGRILTNKVTAGL